MKKIISTILENNFYKGRNSVIYSLQNNLITE